MEFRNRFYSGEIQRSILSNYIYILWEPNKCNLHKKTNSVICGSIIISLIHFAFIWGKAFDDHRRKCMAKKMSTPMA